MLEKRMYFAELMSGMAEEFRKRGQTYKNQLNNLYYCETIQRIHEARGLEYLDRELIAEHIARLQERLGNGDLSKRAYQNQYRTIRLLIEYNDTGTISWENIRAGSTYKLNAAFSKIADAYLAGSGFHPNTRNDGRWVAHKYFTWLTENNHHDLSTVSTVDVQKFMVFCAKNMAPSSMHDVKLHLRKLYDYLSSSGLSDISYKELLSFKVNRGSKIYPCVPKEEIAAILDAVDRSQKRGKRDYAIMLLGTVLGLRAIDIVNLKLSDINWAVGELRIVQAKTGVTAVLPLTQDVGEAIKEYIFHARPKSKSPNIFLRLKAPHRELKSAVTIGEVYNDWRKAAALSPSKGFHSLRRTLGRDMITTGTPVTVAAQVLGQRNINSVKPYIPLDTKHLKLCALSFDGIAPTVGWRA